MVDGTDECRGLQIIPDVRVAEDIHPQSSFLARKAPSEFLPEKDRYLYVYYSEQIPKTLIVRNCILDILIKTNKKKRFYEQNPKAPYPRPVIFVSDPGIFHGLFRM
jgi:hypothetical protein